MRRLPAVHLENRLLGAARLTRSRPPATISLVAFEREVDATWNEWISLLVPGKTFVDVGGLWGIDNEKVSVAALAGATTTTMIDGTVDDGRADNLWQRFRQHLRSQGVNATSCIQGNIDDPRLTERVGLFDVVHCSGVLYHCPEPLYTLRQLRTITRETLLLGTVTLPEQITATTGRLRFEPGTALFIPALQSPQRAVIGEWLANAHVRAIGINDWAVTEWARDDYAPWWWLFTDQLVLNMLEVAGFRVRQRTEYWPGMATLYRADVRDRSG